MSESATPTSNGGANQDGHVSWRMLVSQADESLRSALGGMRSNEARWLVERVSGYSSSELISNGNELVSARSVAFFDQLLARRCDGEPLQYVLGRWAFRSLELFVDHRVLIPRPETEMVAGLGIDHLHTYKRATIAVDLGCGSSAIGLSVAVEVASADVWITDASADALDVARANLAGLGRAGARVSTCAGSWFDALPRELAGRVDLLISNPPYVATTEVLPEEVVDFEPHLALFGGQSGEECLHVIVDGATEWLAPGGALVLEMAPDQTAAIARRCTAAGFVASIHTDMAGRERAVKAVKPTAR